MAIRTEMQSMINYLRQYGNAAQDDVYQGVTYWTDAQLQDILDQHAQHEDTVLRQYTGTIYALTCPRHVQYASDVKVIDASETEYAITEYNPLLAEFTFATDQSAILYARGLRVNLYEALAYLWDRKADQRFDLNNWKAGNNRMDVRQEYDACIRARDHYRAKTIRRFPRLSGRFISR